MSHLYLSQLDMNSTRPAEDEKVFKEPTSQISQSANTSILDDRGKQSSLEGHSIININDETFEEMEEPYNCFIPFRIENPRSVQLIRNSMNLV